MRWRAVILGVLACCPVGAAARVPISVDAVRTAVARAAGDVLIANVKLLMPVTAAHDDPSLVVDRVRFDAGRQWLEARVRCRVANECVPFYAVAHVDGALPTPLAKPNVAKPNVPPPTVVRRGEQVRLVLERGHARVTLPATCVESGAQGQLIRVRVGQKKFMTAEVMGSGLLRGSF